MYYTNTISLLNKHRWTNFQPNYYMNKTDLHKKDCKIKLGKRIVIQ